MDFVRAFDNVRNKKKLEYAFPSDCVLSYPVTVRRENRLYDGFFAYRLNEDGNSAIRPFGWALLSAGTGEVCAVCDCAAADFISPSEYPLDASLPLALPNEKEIEPKRLKPLQAEIASVYARLREFVFDEGLNRDQVAIIVRYKDLFMQLCHKGLYPFYHALSPAFFHWLRLPLPEKANQISPPDRIESDTRVYQHQLLILENLQQLVKQFNEKIAADDYREKLFDSLHREVQEYKNGLLESLTRHMELDVIRIIDGLDKTLKLHRDSPRDGENCRKLFSMLEGVEMDLRDILYRQGADPFSIPGNDIDVTRQNTVTTVPTSDKALDRKVAARIAEGWEKGGKVIRPERISAYIYSG